MGFPMNAGAQRIQNPDDVGQAPLQTPHGTLFTDSIDITTSRLSVTTGGTVFAVPRDQPTQEYPQGRMAHEAHLLRLQYDPFYDQDALRRGEPPFEMPHIGTTRPAAKEISLPPITLTLGRLAFIARV